jgi:1-acyl-sn-glycerol-3-phosphate acyltransferase
MEKLDGQNMKILSSIRGVLTIFQFVITVLITIVLMYLFRDHTHIIRRTWAKMQTFLMSFSIKEEGSPSSKATLLVLNHQSVVDVVAFEAIYPKNLCWIAKKEIRDIPLFGHIIPAPRMIAIDRKDKRSLIKMLKEGRERVEEGRVLAMFPEGTRTDGTTLLPFQSGAKALAEKLNLIVQPALIIGARHVFDSKKLCAHSGDVRIIYLDPIDPKEDPNWFETLHTIMKERLALELANNSSHR